MPEFRVSWAIDLTADTPRHAARLAREIQRDIDSLATVFTVANITDDGPSASGQPVTIDLTAPDPVPW